MPAPRILPAMWELEANREIAGRYRVVRLIGRGGMGAVYEVEHLHTGQRLAMKVLTLKPGASVERFQREARAASKIQSEHVIRVTDADSAAELGGAPFLVMELLPGMDLERATEGKPLPPAEVVELLRQVARGLDKAHANGIVHRDLKPENLFLTRREDGSPLVKILDFGVAKLSSQETALTRSDQLMGTPSYMAPEQASPDGREIGPPVDLYALGLIAFRLLTGRSYWKPGTLTQLLAQLLTEPMVAPSERGGTPPGFDEWFLRACDRDPAKRFTLAGEQIDALAAALGIAEEPKLTTSASFEDLLKRVARVEPESPPIALPPRRPSPARHFRGGRQARFLLVVGLLSAAVGAFAAHAAWRRLGSPTHSGVTLLDLPTPQTTVPAAAAEYALGIHLQHDNNWNDAAVHYRNAAKLDPTMAAAFFRSFLVGGDASPEVIRGEFERAAELRSGLTERDRELLEAVEPFFGRSQTDLRETVRRVQALSRRYPRDVEILDQLAFWSQTLDLPGSLEAVNRGLELDPNDGSLWQVKGRDLLYLDRIDEGRTALEHCLTLSPVGSDCAREEALVDMSEGHCQAFEDDERRYLDRLRDAASPDLGAAMLGAGRPMEAVRGQFEQQIARLSKDDTAFPPDIYPPLARAQLALVEGDFDQVRAETGRAEAALLASPDRAREYIWHYKITMQRVFADQETGDPEGARKLAGEFDRGKANWAWGGFNELSLFLARLSLPADRPPPASFEASRKAWVEAVAPWSTRGALWAKAFAAPALTMEEARLALEKMHEYEPWQFRAGLPYDLNENFGLIDATVGHVFLLAEKPEEALPYLKRAVASCGVYYNPLDHTRAALDLGEALEQTADKPSACEAYGKVLARWGHAKPRSVTADQARARMAALGCKP